MARAPRHARAGAGRRGYQHLLHAALWASLLLLATAGRKASTRSKAKAKARATARNAGARTLTAGDITSVTASRRVAFLKIRIPGTCPSCAPMQTFWDRVAQAHPAVGIWQGSVTQ